MSSQTHNYDVQAARYALRVIQGSDYVVFRDLPGLLTRWGITGTTVDVGCGTGRSTRYLASLGLAPIGVDINAAMLAEARRLDPNGDYRATALGALPFPAHSLDFIFSSWAVLELSQRADLNAFFHAAAHTLRSGGTLIVVTNTPEFYAGHWVSCEVDFPENTPPLRSGQPVRVRLMPERVELTDTFWSDADYRAALTDAGLTVIDRLTPLGHPADPVAWRDEAHTAPYVIYVARA